MPNRIALIVATYEYQDTGLRQLVAPAQDAEALARVLKDPEVGGFDVRALVNQPSHEVSQKIESFFTDRKLRRDDLILFYFSGHGIKDEEGRLYFATPNTLRTRLRTTAIPATLIHDVMRYSHSRRQVLILDCCYSGAFPKGMLARADEAIGTKERFDGRGRVVLTASDSMQYAFEGDAVEGEGVRSIFTSVLVKGLETGEADLDRDGNVTLDELYDYAYYHIIDETPQQRPGKWTFDVQGDILVARNPYPVIGQAEAAPSPAAAEQIESPAMRERGGGPPRALNRSLPWRWMAGVTLVTWGLFVVAFVLTGGLGKDKVTLLSADRTATAIAAIFAATDTSRPTGTPEPTDTITPQPTRTYEPKSTIQPTLVFVEVHSNQDWQNTDISVSGGETVTITYVSGAWSPCAGDYQCPFVGPEGWTSQDRWNTPDESRHYADNTILGCPHAALIARFSRDKPFCAESDLSIQAPELGYLELRINDAQIGDNDGTLNMQIEVK